MAPFDEGRVEKPEEPEPGKGYPGSELLGRPSPEAVYEGLRDRDPLHIRERCMKRLNERAQLLPIDRLVTIPVHREGASSPTGRGACFVACVR